MMGQQKFGASDGRSNCFAVSVFGSMLRTLQMVATRHAAPPDHCRITCVWKKGCLLDEDGQLIAMSDIELQNHLKLYGLFGKEAAEKEAIKRTPAEKPASAKQVERHGQCL